MSITDELRKVAAKTECANGRCEKLYRGDLDHIADRIDEKHEDELTMERGRAITELGSDIALNYIQLPKDADGETVRIGDVMEWPDGSTFEVVGIGDGTLYYVEGDGADHAEWTVASTKRHHHAPTVEDVLRDVVTLCYNTWKEESPFHFYDVDDVMKSGNIADFAAKLRLAGEDA